ncbi:MAG: sigma-70 family RNA polymerase sigma factor, partial [Clostridiales bacterium]|nr:sigma-70 family RNA polymerase sigma factor [Clostridiales bacterium]
MSQKLLEPRYTSEAGFKRNTAESDYMEDITTTPDYNFAEEDENMLREVIDRYSQPILRYCHHILCSYADAQDAAQTTFIKAYENRSRYKNGASLTAWLYRIAYRTCIDMIRRRRFLILPEKPV